MRARSPNDLIHKVYTSWVLSGIRISVVGFATNITRLTFTSHCNKLKILQESRDLTTCYKVLDDFMIYEGVTS